MANAIAARLQGDDAQAVLFWQKVAELFTNSNVAAVGYEVEDVRGFDDVVVYYHQAIRDVAGSASLVDFWQSKFRVTPSDTFTAANLADPSFIGATKVSLLQRLKDAQRKHAPDGTGARFFLSAPIPFDPTDSLCKIVSNVEGELRLDDLFSGGPKSEMGRLRVRWIEHLELSSEDELRRVLKPLRLRANAPDLSAFREQVSHALRLAGWRPYGDTAASSPYDDLARKFIQGRQKRFTREELEAIGRQEGLIVSAPLTELVPARIVGIRSFARGTEQMPAETERYLCLLNHFDDRWPRVNDAWSNAIVPAIVDFAGELERDRPIHVQVRAHNTIAFAAGYALDSKTGVEAYPVQVSGAHEVWHRGVGPNGPNELWEISERVLSTEGPDLAISISITHEIDEEVLGHIAACLPNVGRLLTLRVLPSVSFTAIRGGAHAHQLADACIAAVRRTLHSADRSARAHIFASAPSGFMFLFGQRARVLGPCTLYEHDFQRERHLAYHSSASFPLQSTR